MNPSILALLAIALLLASVFFWLRPLTVFEYERGLLYRQGRFQRLLNPGRYWLMPGRTTITKVDIRPRFVSIPSQEILTTDGITVKLSLVAQYEITDPYTAINRVADYQTALYTTLQVALRELVSSMALDDVFEQRQTISPQLLDNTTAAIAALGLHLIAVNLKDLMLPGELKKLLAQVVQARKEGLAALERARGETAALRSLANAARLAEDHPAILQLRLVQALEHSAGHRLVVQWDGSPSSGHIPSLPANEER